MVLFTIARAIKQSLTHLINKRAAYKICLLNIIIYKIWRCCEDNYYLLNYIANCYSLLYKLTFSLYIIIYIQVPFQCIAKCVGALKLQNMLSKKRLQRHTLKDKLNTQDVVTGHS